MKTHRSTPSYYLAALLLIVSTACTSEEVTNPVSGDGDTAQQSDSSTPEDAAPVPDASGDEDVQAPTDLTVAEDTNSAADTVNLEDTMVQQDTTSEGDVSTADDTMVPEDTMTSDDAATSEDVAQDDDASNTDTAPSDLGTSATSCGSPNQGLTPVDCTAYGDANAFCVFGNHCGCSTEDGFVCEGWKEGDGNECEPGFVCVAKTPPVDPMEVGHVATSCGASDQGLSPIDCTQYGDKNAVCVFSNHCMCSTEDGYACEKAGQWGDKECDPGVYCKPAANPEDQD